MSTKIRNSIFNLSEGGLGGSYWTPQKDIVLMAKLLYWGKVSEIAGGQMPNKVTDATDYITVLGSPATYQVPNTASYISADTDYIWFTTAAAQRTVTTAELIGYDFPRTWVKYENVSPYVIDEIIIPKSGETFTVTEMNHIRDYMNLSIWWNNVLSFHGSSKDNRGSEMSLFVLSDGNTVARYIAGDLTTITKDGSNIVSVWADKLGSGRNLGQPTALLRPVWSSSGITFLPTMMFTDAFTWIQPEEIYMVVKQIGWTNALRLFDGKTNATGMLRQDTATPQLECYAGSFSNNDSNLAVGSFGIVRVLFNGANSKLQINENAPTTGNFGAANMGGFYIGGSASGTGANIQVKEIILRKVADVTNNDSAIYNFLKTRYGL